MCDGACVAVVAGIDPGWSGAVAIYDGHSMRWEKLEPLRDPTYEDIERVADLLWQADCERAYLEHVWARRGFGLKTQGELMRSFGLCQCLLAACSFEIVLLKPKEWQEAFGLTGNYSGTTEKKRAHKAAAQALLPDETVTLTNVDAFLIAYYGYLQEK